MKEPKEKEKIIFTPNIGLGKIVLNWKKYPLEQWNRELVLGNRIQAHFKIPEKDRCNGTFHKILSEKGIICFCDKCHHEMSVTSHRVFNRNTEIVIQLV